MLTRKVRMDFVLRLVKWKKEYAEWDRSCTFKKSLIQRYTIIEYPKIFMVWLLSSPRRLDALKNRLDAVPMSKIVIKI